MREKIAFEYGQISDFQVLVTLTLNRVILHTIMHHSSTYTYIPNFIEIEETFCVDSYLLPTSKSCDTKSSTKKKSGPDKLEVLSPNLRIRGHLPAPNINWGGDDFWKWQISDFQELVILTLDWVILHTVMHHLSTSTNIPNFIIIEETFCGWLHTANFKVAWHEN